MIPDRVVQGLPSWIQGNIINKILEVQILWY